LNFIRAEFRAGGKWHSSNDCNASVLPMMYCHQARRHECGPKFSSFRWVGNPEGSFRGTIHLALRLVGEVLRSTSLQ
jgi:hypothetical protein